MSLTQYNQIRDVVLSQFVLLVITLSILKISHMYFLENKARLRYKLFIFLKGLKALK